MHTTNRTGMDRPGTRKVASYTNNGVGARAVVRYCPDWCEYIVVWFSGSDAEGWTPNPAANYHTDDRDDAIRTACQSLRTH